MDADSKASHETGSSGHLLANLRELMAAWFQERERGGETSEVEKKLAEAAARQGLALGFRKMALVDVPDDGFPVVLLERSGTSRLILARTADRAYVCHGQGARYTLSEDALQQVESGTIFFARAEAHATRTRPSQSDPWQDTAPAGGHAAARRSHDFQGVDAETTDEAAGPIPFSLWRSSTMRGLVAAMVVGQGRLLGALAAAGLIGNLLFVALPIFSMAVYDKVVPHNASETMVAISIGIMLALITDFGLRAVRTKLSDALALRVQVDFTSRVLQRLLELRMADAPRDPASLLMALRDLEGFCQILPSLFVSLAIDILFVVAICVFLTLIGGYVGLVPLVGIVMLVIVYGISHFLAEREGEKSQKLQRTQSSLVISAVAALETIKAHHGERELAQRFQLIADSAAYAGHRERHFGLLANQAAITIAQMMTVLAMVFSVVAIGAGAMTVGAMSAAAMIVSRVMPPLSQMIGSFHRLWQLRRGIERIDLLMAKAPERGSDHSIARRKLRGDISLHSVSLTYPGASRKALDGVSLHIKAGEKIGLVGRIGCGKTSLMRLIARLADASDGAVSIDDHDIQQYDPQLLRRSVGFLRQDTHIFGGSPASHLALGFVDPDPDRVAEALAISGAADFIKRHPKGLQMPAGPDGQALSGGERQSVALARLVLGDPRIVLLDEPTSAMDNALEAHVIKQLRKWLEGRTAILSTHRVPLLSLVDRIIVMDQGRIVADGPRDEVLRQLSQPAA
jgi:ATP-binding cassette subfamily C protein LapB